MSHIKSVFKIGLVVVSIGALIYSFIPEPLVIDLHTVRKGNLEIQIEGEGKTRIHDIYTVSTPIDGRITRIESEPGDRVSAGATVIANMYPSNPQLLDKRTEVQAQADVEGARAAMELASARVKQAKAQLQFDQSEFRRISELFKKGSISESSLERSKLSIETLKAELETAVSNHRVMESRLAAAEARLLQPKIEENNSATDNCQICIYAPVDGTVLRILHKSESIVPVGTPLVELGNPQDLEVILELLSTDAVKIKLGDEAIVSRWGGDDIKARVRLIEPSGFTKISALGVEEQRVYVLLSFIDPVEKWQALGDAYRVEASIIIDRLENYPLIPITALFRHNEVWSVYKVEDGELVLQTVDVAGRNDRKAAIKSGLEIADKIVSHPANNYSVGMSVEEL